MNRLALRISGQGLVLDDDLDCAILTSSFQDHNICEAIWIPIKPFFDIFQLTSSKGSGPFVLDKPVMQCLSESAGRLDLQCEPCLLDHAVGSGFETKLLIELNRILLCGRHVQVDGVDTLNFELVQDRI